MEAGSCRSAPTPNCGVERSRWRDSDLYIKFGQTKPETFRTTPLPQGSEKVRVVNSESSGCSGQRCWVNQWRGGYLLDWGSEKLIQGATQADDWIGRKSRVADTWPASQCYTDRRRTDPPSARSASFNRMPKPTLAQAECLLTPFQIAI